MQLAITRQVSRSIQECELTFMARQPIDIARARQQHAEYEQALLEMGLAVLSLPEIPDLPDAVFVEDTALVLDECAIILRPGAASRLPEIELMDDLLGRFRQLHRVQAPARVDGGDILRVGRRIFVGQSARTDAAAYEQIRSWLEPSGYRVEPALFSGCLHLKSAVTEIGPDTVLLNPEWIDPQTLGDVTTVHVDASEQHAANAVHIGDKLLFPEAYPRTRERLRALGLRVQAVAADELAKAEGALTCCSLIFEI